MPDVNDLLNRLQVVKEKRAGLSAQKEVAEKELERLKGELKDLGITELFDVETLKNQLEIAVADAATKIGAAEEEIKKFQ